MELAEYKNALSEQDDTQVEEGFKGANIEPAPALVVGDSFTIPENYTVYSRMIGTLKWQFTPVEVTHTDGTTDCVNIGKSVFNQSFDVYAWANENNLNEGIVKTNKHVRAAGSAHDEFMKHGNLDVAFQSIAGKKIVIKDVKEYLHRGYHGGEPYSAKVFTSDFA